MTNRFKNYGLWLAIVALILDVLLFANVITLANEGVIQALVQRALELLVVAGILSNPTNGSGFHDEV